MPPAQSIRRINCDFFHIHHRGDMDFIRSLETLFTEHPDAPERNWEMLDGMMAIVGCHERNGGIDGVMMRTRRDPKKVAEVETHHMEELSPKQGCEWADECHFFYHPEYQALVIQRNRQTGGAHRITDYLHAKVGANLEGRLILTPEGVSAMDKITHFTGIKAIVQMPDQLSMFDQWRESVSASIGRLGRLGPRKIEITLNMDRKRKTDGMKPEEVREFVGDLLAIPSQTKSIEVKGHYYSPNLGRENVEMDLIGRRLQGHYEVEPGANHDTHATLMRAEYTKKRSILSEQFGRR